MKIILLIAGILFISACGEKEHSVDEFLKNESIRTEFQKKCKNGMHQKTSSNCNNVASAINIITQAENGIVEKQLLLGEMYFAEKNFQEAARWLTMAAEKGSYQAINKIGMIIYLIGSRKNLTKVDENFLYELEKQLNKYKNPNPVLDYYLQKLSSGDNNALISLGIMYNLGQGVKKNHDTAFSYFKSYSELNNQPTPGWGEYYLGHMYLDGEGVGKDEEKAIDLFRRSCQAKFKLSCYKLGVLYFNGGSTFKPDYKKSIKFLDVYTESSAVDIRAEEYVDKLFVMYENGGYGINKNPKRIEKIKEILCEKQHRFCDEK